MINLRLNGFVKGFLFVLLLSLQSALSVAGGYNGFVSAGVDNVREGEERKNASFGQFKLSTQGRLFRLHSSFTLLSGAEYMEGEVAMGLDLYLLTPFVDPDPYPLVGGTIPKFYHGRNSVFFKVS